MYKNEKLEEFEKYMEGKKVAIIGLGVSNIPLLDYFYQTKSDISVFDNRNKEQLESEIIEKIEKYDIHTYLGKENLQHLKGFDIIFRPPSAMPFIPEIEEEIKRGAIVTSEIEMVLKLSPSKIIGVTGSDGKKSEAKRS